MKSRQAAIYGAHVTADQEQLLRTVLWRRTDIEGMDACSFEGPNSGYLISGTAFFQDQRGPSKISYQVLCNADWSSQSAWVSGWLGASKLEFSLSCEPEGKWIKDAEEIVGVDGLLDVDLGFTPATNTNAIRRLRLAVGDEVETTAVWLDTEDWNFKPLRQVYRRLSETEFLYSSPSHDYLAKLVTDEFGIIRQYPDLWTAISEREVGIN